MQRRDFLKSSAAACLATGALAQSNAMAETNAKPREYYELRAYSLKPGKQAELDDYLSKAFIPAVRRLGLGPVGVFYEKGTDNQLTVYVLIAYKAAGQAAELAAHLAADEEYRKAAAAFLDAKAADPIYDRIESSLLGAIAGMPKLEAPDTTKARLLNLRIYESHNERAAAKKIEMFNLHELALFRRVGLTPVLFGETLIGPKRPNLTYMLVFPDDAGRQAAWNRFRTDEEWLKLKAMPEYADKEIVSHITNKILEPAPYSGI
jgi:hypothetical protein